jgi:hypothetical protein
MVDDRQIIEGIILICKMILVSQTYIHNAHNVQQLFVIEIVVVADLHGQCRL